MFSFFFSAKRAGKRQNDVTDRRNLFRVRVRCSVGCAVTRSLSCLSVLSSRLSSPPQILFPTSLLPPPSPFSSPLQSHPRWQSRPLRPLDTRSHSVQNGARPKS